MTSRRAVDVETAVWSTLRDTQPDWYNLPSQPSFTKYAATVYKGSVDKAVSMNAWTTLQIHGIGDPWTWI